MLGFGTNWIYDEVLVTGSNETWFSYIVDFFC